MPHALFVFTTREGQTAKIINCMTQEFVDAGWQTSSVNLKQQVFAGDLSQFERIVVGGPIHYGKHDPALMQFLQQHAAELDQADTSLFSVNLTARKPEKNTPQTNAYIKKLLTQLQFIPKRSFVFAGALLYPDYNLFDKYVIRFIMWLTKGCTDLSQRIEYTDWQQVKDAAGKIRLS